MSRLLNAQIRTKLNAIRIAIANGNTSDIEIRRLIHYNIRQTIKNRYSILVGKIK